MRIIQNGSLVNAYGIQKADIGISNGIIEFIAPRIQPAPGDTVLDAESCLVFPGFIDAHTHFAMDNGTVMTADDFETGTTAALSGGTTTIIDFATQSKGGNLSDALAAWQQKAEGHSSCHYGFHMAITDWTEGIKTELPHMIEKGVTSFKLYMAYRALMVNDAEIYEILKEMKAVGGFVGVHCENGTLVEAFTAALLREGKRSPAAHPLSRPPELEAEAISRLLYIAKAADWPVAIVHLSSALGLQEVRKARKRGQRVFVETCPQYLFLDDDLYSLPGLEGAKYVCSPPLRKAEDQSALLQALTNGEINSIATDHCSYRFDGQKTLGAGDFTKIPNGLPGVESRPQLIFSRLVDTGLITPEDMCGMLSTCPAHAYGLYPRKGALQVGSDADIVVWERHGECITAKTHHQNTDYTPYEGFLSTGRPRAVLLYGEIAAQECRVIAPRLGRYLHRDVSSWQ